MENLVANVDHHTFDIELNLRNQTGALPLPFPGMDKSGSAVCEFYVTATCPRGTSCPFRHVRGDKTIVCKHWLRGLCKKGDQCEFLHEYDMSKMPECYFYTRFNACHNKECPFLHIDPETKMRDCPWYDRGFCRHGPSCRHRHVRRILCINYLAGFCPEGSACTDAHPRFELPAPSDIDPKFGKKVVITCHFCQEPGHKVSHCPKMPPEMRAAHQEAAQQGYMMGPGGQYRANSMPQVYKHYIDGGTGTGPPQRRFKNLEDIVCFKCGENGHFANRCPKGALSFLSNKGPQAAAAAAAHHAERNSGGGGGDAA